MVPVSHRPVTKMPSIEIPSGFLRGGGLDGRGCYVIPSEVNTMEWPSRAWDHQLLPKGTLPWGFVREVQAALVKLNAAGALKEVDREGLAREVVEKYRSRDR